MVLEIGAEVHRYSVDRKCSAMAVIAVVSNDDDGGSKVSGGGCTYDIILSGSGAEESEVPEELLEPVPSELKLRNCTTAQQCKDAGNALFTRIHDNASAIKCYLRALELLLVVTPNDDKSSLTAVGAAVLVQMKGQSGEYQSGMVAGLEEENGCRSVEVVYDNDEEESGINLDRLVKLAEDDEVSRELQRSCCLNLSRAYFKEGKHGWAIRYASLALAVTRVVDGKYHNEVKSAGYSTDELPERWRGKIADALYVRGKALLAAGRHVTAKVHADLLCSQEIDKEKGRTLEKEVHSFRVRRMKSNRVLAKRMGEWVEEAVETNRRMSSQQQLEQMGGGDLPMPGEREVDENDGAYGEEEGVGGVSKEGDDNCAVM